MTDDPPPSSAGESGPPPDQPGPVLPPSRFGAGYTVGQTHRPADPAAPAAGGPSHQLPGWSQPTPSAPGDPDAAYNSQAAHQFGGQPEAHPSLGGAPDAPAQAWPAAPPLVYPGHTGSANSDGRPAPADWNNPNVQPPGPYGYPAQNAPNANLNRVVLIVGAAVIILVTLLILRWFLSLLVSGSGWILILLTVVAGGAYLWYRDQNPQQAHHLEAQLKGAAQAAVSGVASAVKSVTGSGSAHGWNAPPGPPPAGGAAAPHFPQQPVPPPPANVAGTPAPWPPTAGHVGANAAPAGGAAANDIVFSTLLLVPSLIAYGVMFTNVKLASAWPHWWIFNGVNLFFVFCVAVRARTNRAPGAVLLALLGTVLVGLATSPSPKWSLTALLSTTHSYGAYSYETPPTDLLPWIVRTPMLAIIIFVAAWGVARRRSGGWVVGLVPTGLLVWYSIWYQEHESIGKAGWFGFWLLSVGVMVGGCIACWVIDVISKPRAGYAP